MNIAIVEDDAVTREETAEYCRRFQAETNAKLLIREFSDGRELVDNYDSSFDLIFLDIEMNYLNTNISNTIILMIFLRLMEELMRLMITGRTIRLTGRMMKKTMTTDYAMKL